MTRRRARRGPWLVAAAIGAAAIGYFVRALPPARWGGATPGMWDVTIAVVTEPRFLVIICFTSMLLAAVVRREAVLPELIRLGSWRAYLAHEAAAAARAISPSAVVVLAVCLSGGVLAGLPWQSLPTPGSTAGGLAAAGIPGPIGVLAQTLQAMLALTVLQLAMTAIRIAAGSIIPVVTAALVLFSWSSVSVLALVTTITSGPAPSVSVGLDAGAIATLNTITYLNLPAALTTGLPAVAAGLGVITGLSFGAATVLDLRVARARKPATRAALQHAQ